MGKLPKGWNERRFGDITINFDGKRIPVNSGDRTDKQGIYPYYGASGIIDYVEDFIFDGEYLLVSEDGANLLARTYPIAFIAYGKFWVNNHAHIVQARIESTQNKFLEYFFASFNVSEFVTGSAQPKLNQKNLNSIQIPLPPLPEQTRIVSKLDALFVRIDQSIALLEENIKHTRGLMASVLEELFEKLNAESTIYKIKDIAEIKGGKRLPKGESIQDEKTDYPYIRVTDFTDDGTIDVNSVKYMNKSVQEQIKRYIITSKDLYISIAGTIGKTGIIPKELENANLTENAARLVFKPNIKINNRFVYYFTLSDNFKDQVGLATKTVAQPKLALQRLAEVELPIPSIEVQNKEVQIFNELSQKFQEINKQQQSKLTSLKALKSSLLDRAFKGELTKSELPTRRDKL
jgi:type I restriction enzyme S subunit